MDLNKLFIISLRRPSDLPLELRELNLKLNSVIEGAIFIAVLSALFDALIKLIIISDNDVSETVNISGFLLTITPLSMFAFQLIILFSIMLSILFFGNFSNQKVSIEELGKNVLFVCLVSFVLNLMIAIFLLISNLLFFYMNILKSIWFVWALSSVVAILYNYKSIMMTALLGAVTTSLIVYIMGFLFMTLMQFLSGGNTPNV